jgi:hypothetical protein
MQTDGGEDGAQQHADALCAAVQPMDILPGLGDE